jgi:hypothetical protein
MRSGNSISKDDLLKKTAVEDYQKNIRPKLLKSKILTKEEKNNNIIKTTYQGTISNLSYDKSTHTATQPVLFISLTKNNETVKFSFIQKELPLIMVYDAKRTRIQIDDLKVGDAVELTSVLDTNKSFNDIVQSIEIIKI